MMDTTSPVTVTLIYWDPAGYVFTPENSVTYPSVLNRFVTDIAKASGTYDIFSVLNQYTDGQGHAVQNQFVAGKPITVTTAFPAANASDGCTPDDAPVYSNGNSNTVCVTDQAVTKELASVEAANKLSANLKNLYVVVLPRRVEECLTTKDIDQGGTCAGAGTNRSTGKPATNQFCGYHSSLSGTVYAVLPYAVVDGRDGLTCGGNAGSLGSLGDVVGNQAPNHNVDADVEVSVLTHEIAEAVTDPYTSSSNTPQSGTTGWMDAQGNEVADECAYNYGDSLQFLGSQGIEYNQVINGDQYFVQSLFSQAEFAVAPFYACALTSQQSVLLDPNGGTGQMAPLVGAGGTTANLPLNTYLRTGYQFGGWNSDGGGRGQNYPDGSSVTVTDQYLYATWVVGPNETVTLDPNGGVGAQVVSTSNYPQALPLNTFTEANRVFAGWSTNPGGGGSTYANGGLFPYTSTETLYAQWTYPPPPPPVNLTYNAGTNMVNLSWTPPTLSDGNSIEGYVLTAGTSQGANTITLVGNPALILGHSFKLTHLMNGSAFWVNVSTVGPGGASAPTSIMVGTNGARVQVLLSLSRSVVASAKVSSVVARMKVQAKNSVDVPVGRIQLAWVVRPQHLKVLCTLTLSQGAASCHFPKIRLPKGRNKIIGVFIGNHYDYASDSAPSFLTAT